MKKFIVEQASQEIKNNNSTNIDNSQMKSGIIGFLIALVLCLSAVLSWILFCPHFKRLTSPKIIKVPEYKNPKMPGPNLNNPKGFEEETPKNGFNL